jgi:regulatory protein
LKGRALRYLAGREHSRAELERKLRAYEEPGTLTQVLDALQALGYLDEQRVAESVVFRRAPRLGAARIRHELQSKGLDAQTVQQTLDSLRPTEVERAHAVWRKKFAQPALDAAGRAKQQRFLAARGFGADTIRRVVTGSGDEFGDESV